MAINKIVYGNETLIDLTNMTATTDDVVSGKTFYQKDGTLGTGTLSNTGSYTFVTSKEYEVEDVTTTNSKKIGTITIPSSAFTKDKILYIRVRDKAGKRTNHFLGSDSFYTNPSNANGTTSSITSGGKMFHRYSSNGVYEIYANGSSDGYGVYPSFLNATSIDMYRKYNVNYSYSIGGTYLVEVYLIDYPDGKSVFDI